MVYVNVMLPLDPNRSDDRQFELTVYNEGILLERNANEMYDYESVALSKEQALRLAAFIFASYDIK